VWETAHISNIKDSWRASNRIGVELQACRHLDRRDIMQSAGELLDEIDGSTAAARAGSGVVVKAHHAPVGRHLRILAVEVVGGGETWLPVGASPGHASATIGERLLTLMNLYVPGGFDEWVSCA